MRQQVPMVFLLLLVYLGAVAYISIEISLGSCWCRDILRVKGQGLITICNFFVTLCDMQLFSGNYSMRHSLWKFVAENNTEKSQLLWNSILQKEMLHWKFFSAI